MALWLKLFYSEMYHYDYVIMGAIASQITSLTIVYSTVYSDADQRKHQGSASLAFVRGIHRGPVNSPHKWPVTRKMFPFVDVIMIDRIISVGSAIGSLKEYHMLLDPILDTFLIWRLYQWANAINMFHMLHRNILLRHTEWTRASVILWRWINKNMFCVMSVLFMSCLNNVLQFK